MRRTCIFLLFFTFYNLCSANGIIRSDSDDNINWITVWLSFLFGVLFTVLFRFLNGKSKTIDQRSDAGLPLGGWIILLGLTLVARFLFQGYALFNGNFFFKSTWVRLEHTGHIKLYFLSIFELFLALFSLASTSFLLYWFLGRRDIFPIMFVYYITFFLITHFILWIVYTSTALPAEWTSNPNEILIQFFGMVVYAVICGVYVRTSKRVKQTFVYPPN